jgi:hypothetical protein
MAGKIDRMLDQPVCVVVDKPRSAAGRCLNPVRIVCLPRDFGMDWRLQIALYPHGRRCARSFCLCTFNHGDCRTEPSEALDRLH